MIGKKEHVLQHMRRLWNNWRGSLHKNMKSKPFCDALKDVPRGVDNSDWEWLETSARNIVNRSKLSMPHRTGSKPIREIIYELGGKDGKPPNMDTIFFETRKKDNKIVEPKTNAKYVVEKCFGPQCKSHVIGFGGGITAKELKGGNSSKDALLDKLNAREKEKESLKRRLDELQNKCECMDELESKYEQLARVLLGQHSTPASSSDQ
ncbi:hypothetical protein KY289_000865 [Solanum tuberosum]|nr:hypothetical protein KY289_000865 [Solanum tuberosum]